jgi:hypothetical protein
VDKQKLRDAAERRRTGDYSALKTVNDRCLQPLADAEFLADAYLTEHPADDNEPLTGEWLESLGAKSSHWATGTCDYSIPSDGIEVDVRIWSQAVDTDPEAIISNAGHNDNVQIQVKTRADVRLLCRALRIELKEQP